jgi:hypothetical protein
MVLALVGIAGTLLGLLIAAATFRDDWLFRHAWEMQPNGTGIASDVQVARYATAIPADDARRVADAALEPFGIAIPPSALRVEVDVVDFESEQDAWVEDGTLVRVMLPGDEAEAWLAPEVVGWDLSPSTGSWTVEDLQPWVLDLMGEYVDLHVPVAERRSVGEPWLAVVAPYGDPAEVTFLVYDPVTRM